MAFYFFPRSPMKSERAHLNVKLPLQKTQQKTVTATVLLSCKYLEKTHEINCFFVQDSFYFLY